MTRKAKLEKALARRYIPSHEVMNAEFVGGLNYHADRLAPLHAALIEAVKALEKIASGFKMDEDCRTCEFDNYIVKEHLPNCEFLKANKALAKIDEAIEGMGRE